MTRRNVVKFLAVRVAGTKTGYRTEWLSGSAEPGEAKEEAQSLVDDPNDTIVRISLWSEQKEQFIGVVRRAERS